MLVTLGSAVATYVIGVLLTRYESLDDIGQAFYFISGLVAPLGLGVLVDSMGVKVGSTSVMLLLSVVLFLAYAASFAFLKQELSL